MVGVPVVSNIDLLVGLFADFGDSRMPVDRLEEAIDIDLAPAPGERRMLLLSKTLVPKDQDAVIAKGLIDFGE